MAAGQACKAEPSLYSAAIGGDGEKKQAERTKSLARNFYRLFPRSVHVPSLALSNES